MEENDAKYWTDKGNEFFASIDYDLAIKNCEKAAQLDPNNASIFISWGKALSLLAFIKKDESLFRESFEKFKKAVQLDPNDASVFMHFGNALSELARTRQDETLFSESFEKYGKAAILNPNDASVFYAWGYALSELAGIKQDESLFRESFGKFSKAVELDPNNSSAFIYWAFALLRLAIIKQDESLFRESSEKYKKVTQLNPNDASAFINWGFVLSELARIKQDESLLSESLEKYNKAAQLEPNDISFYANLGFLFYQLARVKHDVTLFRKSLECFIKSKKDILYIFVTFDLDKNDRDYVNENNSFYSLLDSDNDDGKFFKDVTKDISDKEKIDDYKKAYILSISIISQLYVGKNKNEKYVAHYLGKRAAKEMLFNNSKFRLHAVNYSNDPTEGKILLDYLFGEKKYPVTESINTEYGAFTGCFIFNYDSLNQFRLYGKEGDKEGTGLSLVFRDSFFSKEVKMAIEQISPIGNYKRNEGKQEHALFRCIYVDPETQRVIAVGRKEEYIFYREKNEERIEDYNNYIDRVTKSVREEMEELKNLVKKLDPKIAGKLLVNLRYLTKHAAFKEEQECRIVKIHPLNDKDTVKIDPSLDDKNNSQIDNIKMYIEYRHIPSYIEKIYFGPKFTKMELFQDLLRHEGKDIPCIKSTNPLA